MDFADFNQRHHLIYQLPHRIRVAYAIDCANRVLHKWANKYPNDRRPQKSIAVAKGYLLEMTEENMQKANEAALDTFTYPATYAAYAAYTAYYAAKAAAYYSAYAATNAACESVYASAGTLHVINGDWTPVERLYAMAKGPAYAFDERWLTSDAVALVKGIVMDDAFDRMPILADALQDAGFDDVELLTQMQTEQCGLSHWIIWNVMGWGK